MTAPAGRARARAAATLASAGITVLAMILMGLIWSAPSDAQILPTTTTTTSTTLIDPTSSTIATTTTTTPSEWDGSRWTGPTANGETVGDGTFSGTFVHAAPTPGIATVDLSVFYSAGDVHTADCGTGPGPQRQQTPPTTTTPSGAQSSTASFLFEVAFVCNGIYDATATARLEGSQGDDLTKHDLTLKVLHIAVPPQPPLAVLATDNGNQTVTLAWQPPQNAPPDLLGYRVSRREPSTPTFTALGDSAPAARSFDDTNIPSTGGSYFYMVETLRKSPNGTLTSDPVITSGALAVAGGSGGGGRTVGGIPSARTPGGEQHFDTASTLAADEGEPGEGDFALPGAGTIQRFAGRDGAGLVKPFAAALDLAVWAGLLLFLTRRAATADRAERLAVHLEHPS
jgi:hypothetical protein